MTQLARGIRYQILDSELEAIFVEAELIKTHQPYFNSRLKDDKSTIYLLITKEEFPKVLRLRKTDLKLARYQKNLGVFGPFASGYRLNEILKLIRPIFRWCNHGPNSKHKACLYYHLDLCAGPCCDKISATDYQATIAQLVTFLRGQKQILLRELTTKMQQAAEKEAYEAAQAYKNQLELIKEISSSQKTLKTDLWLPNLSRTQAEAGLIQLRKILHDQQLFPSDQSIKRIEGYDVSNTMGQQATVSMVVLTDGEPDHSEYKFFKIKSLATPNDYGMLQEALTRRQNHPEWPQPDVIMIDGGRGQVNAVRKIWHWHMPVIGLVKNPDRIVVNGKILRLPADHPTLQMLQRLRDEAHRFAKKHHTRLRTKNLLESL